MSPRGVPITLEDFEVRPASSPRRVLNSPRSLHVCKVAGILLEDLVPRSLESFCEKGILPEVSKMRFEHFEKKRAAKVAFLRNNRNELIAEEERASQQRPAISTYSDPYVPIHSPSSERTGSEACSLNGPSPFRQHRMSLQAEATMNRKREQARQVAIQNALFLEKLNYDTARVQHLHTEQVEYQTYVSAQNNKEIARKVVNVNALRRQHSEIMKEQSEAKEMYRLEQVKNAMASLSLRAERDRQWNHARQRCVQEAKQRMESVTFHKIQVKLTNEQHKDEIVRERMSRALHSLLEKKRAATERHRETVLTYHERLKNETERRMRVIQDREERTEETIERIHNTQQNRSAWNALFRQQRIVQAKCRHQDIVDTYKDCTQEKQAVKQERARQTREQPTSNRLKSNEAKRLEDEVKKKHIEELKRREKYQRDYKYAMIQGSEGGVKTTPLY